MGSSLAPHGKAALSQGPGRGNCATTPQSNGGFTLLVNPAACEDPSAFNELAPACTDVTSESTGWMSLWIALPTTLIISAGKTADDTARVLQSSSQATTVAAARHRSWPICKRSWKGSIASSDVSAKGWPRVITLEQHCER